MIDEKKNQPQPQEQQQPLPPPPPADLMLAMRSIYDDLDKSVNFILDQAAPKDAATCRRGCAHCCHRIVLASIPEGMLLARYVLDLPDWKDQMRVLGRAARKFVGDDVTPKSYFKQELPCVFLDSKTKDCQVYPIRPLNCRYWYVKSAPEHCAPTGNHELVECFDYSKTMEYLAEFLKEAGIRPISAPIPLMTIACIGMIAEVTGNTDQLWESDRWMGILGTNPLAWYLQYVQKAMLDRLNKLPVERIDTSGPSDVARGSAGNSETDAAVGEAVPVDPPGGPDTGRTTDSHGSPELHAEGTVPSKDT